MNKKVMILLMMLIMVFAVPPVLSAPATRTPYTVDVVLTITEPGVEWVSVGGIYNVRGMIAMGTFDSTELGISGEMYKTLDYTINQLTGKGTMHGQFVLTVPGVGTIEGSFRDRITDATHFSGTVVGQGTGGFEGMITRGTWEGDLTGITIENVVDAVLISTRG
jgi:hypothetical protein